MVDFRLDAFTVVSLFLVARESRTALAILFLLAPLSVQAAPEVIVNTPLQFGIVALRANDIVSTIRISDSGSLTATGDFIPIGGATPAELRFTGFPAGVLLEFEFDESVLSEGGFNLPEFLTVTGFEHPQSRLTDNTGSVIVVLGARLQTSGSGVAYPDAPYSGSVPLRVRYWQPDAEDYVVHFDTLEVTAELQSTLNLTELQPLSFGAIAAFSDPAGVASLRIAPTGTLFSEQMNQARILPLGGSTPGRFLVNGAAPNVRLSINLPTDPIFLAHDELGASALRFSVESFESSPMGSGITDAKGELNFALGATLKTVNGSAGYPTGNYSGSYTLTVSY